MLASPCVMPGHILLPAPNGVYSKSLPRKSILLPSNLSGLNSSASSQNLLSLAIAQTFTNTLVPFGTS
uniref:Uncharacterized protein n=1 Tax=Arundo donax TaxID=35708 RepID=A0A0A9BK53_ARUDO